MATVTATVPALAGKFYPKGSIDSVALTGPPAEPGTPEFDQEMFAVLWLQESRTPELVAFAREAVDLERFAPIVATGMVNADTKALAETLDQIIHEVREDYNAVKANYDIPRPFVINDAVQPGQTPIRSPPIPAATRSGQLSTPRSCPTSSRTRQSNCRHLALRSVMAG